MMSLEDSIRWNKEQEEDCKKYITYIKVKQKWYKKIWYFITFRKSKIAKWQRLDNIETIYEGNGDFEIMEVEVSE